MSRLSLILILLIALYLGCSQKQAGVKPGEKMDPTALLEKADQLYSADNVEAAAQSYAKIYNNFPTSREYIDAVIGLSRCYNDMGNYEKGMDLLYNLIRENMIPSRVPDIYNEMAKYYEVNAGISSVAGLSNEEKDYRKAIEYYRKGIHYPNSNDKEAKSYAQYRIGELYISLLEFKKATLAFVATTHDFPETKWAQAAELRLTEMRQAVNKVLSESEAGAETPATTPVVETAPETRVTDQPADTSHTPEIAPQDTIRTPADTTTVPEVTSPTDTSKAPGEEGETKTPADTTSKPKLELK